MGKKGFAFDDEQPKAIVCMGEEIKATLLAILADYPDQNGAQYAAIIEAMPICDSGAPIEAADISGGTGAGQAEGKERPAKNRTAYQQFVSDCMKGKNISSFCDSASALKECAAEWKATKK